MAGALGQLRIGILQLCIRMYKLYALISLLLAGLLSACGTAVPLFGTEEATATSAPPTATAVPSQTPAPTATLLPPTATPSPTPEPDMALDPASIYYYPVPDIYAGEQVTFQVAADLPAMLAPEEVEVAIFVDGKLLSTDVLRDRNRAGEPQTLFKWVWDTTSLSGNYQVEIVLDPDDRIQAGDADQSNNRVVLAVTVQETDALPATEAGAVWVTARNDCCRVHVVSGTAAYRDLPQLLQEVDTAVATAAGQLGESRDRQLDVYLIDKVLGQGGYAGSIMVVSYLDRHYAASELQQILIHEAIHVLDRRFAPQRIAFLAEGVAVWGSGGHYKPEDIETRTAALLQSGEYVPLPQLIDNFYPVQHEIGYLQAAGFVSYLIQRSGWQQFKNFYADVTGDDAVSLSEAVNLNLQIYYGTTLAQIEAEWLAYLADLRVRSDDVRDLQTTLRYYNVMRHYQTVYDPTAYFLTAWLPYPNEVREQGNPADLTRHPQTELNVTLEVMLQAANSALRSGDYNKANVLLDSVERVLASDGAFVDPLAVGYLEAVRTAAAFGYEVQSLDLSGKEATLMVTAVDTVNLEELRLQLEDGEWFLAN